MGFFGKDFGHTPLAGWGRGVAAFVLLVAVFAALWLTPGVSADTSSDVTRNLINQSWYISQTAQNKLKGGADESTILADTVSNLHNKNRSCALAILDNTTIPAQYNGDAYAYAQYLLNYINPKPDVVVVVNGDKSLVGLATSKLSRSDEVALQDAARSNFTSGTYANAMRQLALGAEQKISDQETFGRLLTIGIIVLVVLVIGGVVAFLLISTSRGWKKQLAAVQQLNSQVSDLVVRVSDGIDYLPDSNREQVRSQFGQATAAMSKAESGLHELEAATPIQLVLNGGKYRQQLNATGSQLQSSLNMLQQLDRSVEKA